MIIAAVAIAVVFAVTLAALVFCIRSERRRVDLLAQRLTQLENEAASTIVFEPQPEPRLPHQLLN